MSNLFWLEESSLGTLILDASSSPFIIESYDPGFPAPRAVVDAFPDQYGTIDQTALWGPRLITLGLRVKGTRAVRQAAMFTLRQFWQPGLRPALVWDGDAMPILRAVGRGQALTGAIAGGAPYKIQAQFAVPNGTWESYALNTLTFPPSGGSVAGGRSYDLTFDRTYPALSAPLGTNVVTVNGTVLSDFVVQLYGPVAGCGVFQNLTTGLQMTLTANGGLAIAAGDYLQIDTRNRTILLNGSASHYDLVDWTSSQWWTLQPGPNTLRWNPTTPTGASSATIVWRDQYL
jgi:hypothetical protein